jgi:predicted Zn-dependent peptidase
MKIADFEGAEPSPGFRVFVHPTPKFKTLTLAVHVHQPLGDEATKLALLPSVLRRGCRGYADMRRIVTYLEKLYGASMGVDVLKIGERHILGLRLEVVNDRFAPRKIRALEQALAFLWKLLSQPVSRKGALHPPYVSQEKENLKRAIEGMINDRMAYAYERCVQEMCRGEAYSRYEYGRLEEVDPITPRTLFSLHRRLLGVAPVDLFVVGDVDPGRVTELASRIFRLGRRKIRPIPPTDVREGPAEGPREVSEKLDVEQGKLVLGCRTGTAWGRPEMFPLIVANGLLGAFPHSKLFAQVREREGLAYAVHSALDHAKGLLFVTAGIDPSKYARCVEVIRAQMADVAAGRFTEEEWEKTRRTLSDRVRSREDNPAAKIGSFAEMLLGGKPMTAGEITAALDKVTREDVVRAAARVRPDTLFFLTRP